MKQKSEKTLLLRFSSFLLCLALLFALPLNASAASDGTEDIIATDMNLTVVSDSGDITDLCKFEVWNNANSYLEYNGFAYVRVPLNKIQGSTFHCVWLTEPLDISADHEYELSFDYGILATGAGNSFLVQLIYYDAYGEVVDATVLYSKQPSNDDPISVNFSFKPETSKMPTGYSCKLEFSFARLFEVPADYGGGSFFFISNEISFVDKDDDSGWFQKIINSIKEIPEKLGSLGDRISNFFSDLKNGIGSFFSEQWNNIKGAFDNVGTWFIELGDKFNEAIGAVGEFIIDGIREILQWAFVPSEEFMDEYIQVIRDKYEEHFGIFAQVTLFLTDTLEYIDSLMDYDYEFVFPEVSLPIAGKTYVIIEKQTVNMKQWLGSGSFGAELYSIYQTCVWAIIIFCIFKYALVVEDVIISGTSSLATKEVVRGYL